MIERACVVGAGRVGSAVGARLAERGVELSDRDPQLYLLCVPDRAVSDAARQLSPGPWLAHVSGATPLAALDPHTQRVSVHPLQTLTRPRGPEQLDGTYATETAKTDVAGALGG